MLRVDLRLALGLTIIIMLGAGLVALRGADASGAVEAKPRANPRWRR